MNIAKPETLNPRRGENSGLGFGGILGLSGCRVEGLGLVASGAVSRAPSVQVPNN